MLSVSVKQAKEGFFDSKKVQRAVDKATRKTLSRFGAFVRTRARSSIRKRKDVSAPMGPPHGHVGTLRKLIFFAYDASRKSVVIGPALLHSGSRAGPLLEAGGVSVGPGGEPQRYRPRPFMGPAFLKEQESLPKLWRGAVRP